MGPDSRIRSAAPALLGFGLPFGLVLYLAMRGGGYDVLIRDEVGVAVWVAVMVCALIGVPLLGVLTRPAKVALALLALLTLWIALASLWSESAERSVEELGRVGTYLGVFVLALAIQGRDGPRRTLFGVGAAIGLVGALAVLSRLHPEWFPVNEAAESGSLDALRLNYPLNYWNGLGTFLAMGIPLLTVAALDARNAIVRMAATVAIPLASLALFLTYSRGAWLTAFLAVASLVVAHPRRLKTVPLLVLVGAGSAALIFAANGRGDLKNGLDTPLAQTQGDELLAITIVVCLIVALARMWLDRAERKGFELHTPQTAPRTVAVGLACIAAAGLSLATAVGLPGTLSDAWDEFKQPNVPEVGSERIGSFGSNGRIEYWGGALDAGSSAPFTGIGPGAWDLWWSREATISGFTRDAHSLYLETFAEIGLIGVLLLVGFVGTVVFAGASRARLAAGEESSILAGGIAAAVAFAVAMALDWGWEIAAIPVAFLFVAAALLGPERASEVDTAEPGHRREPLPARIGLMITSVAILIVIVTAMQGVRAINGSKERVDAGELDAALEDIDQAEGLQPYAMGPVMQRSLVLQLQGDLDAAAVAAVEATEMEPTNWRPWFTLARIEKARGDLRAAEQAYAEALALNPMSTTVLSADPSPAEPEQEAQ